MACIQRNPDNQIMQRVSTTLFCFLAVLLVAATGASVMGVEKQFALFKKRYNRKYTSAADEQRALEAFKANLATIRRLRKLNPGARFGITKFADMTPEEFRRGRRSVVPKVGANRARAVAPKNSSIPQTLNWITRGAVTPVQNQGECGSDWAFSTVANIEGVNFVKNNRLTALSVEELLDCDTASNGCDGGFMANAYEFLLQKQGGNIMTAASWPYTSGASNCSYVNKTVGATITGYVQIAEDEDTIRSYTATYGPVAVAVDAESWQFYQSGVLVNCTFSELTSGVAIVGYNDATTTPYWIVKNSWGADWGMNGYIYVQKGVNACGIKNYALTAFAAKY